MTPTRTWSEWSVDQIDPTASSISAPPGRFVQYRVKLATKDPRRTPELRSVSLSFRTSNLAPEITRLDVPDVSTADGAARQTRLNVRWDASDPNDDDLSFTLKVRKEGWPDWIKLHRRTNHREDVRLGYVLIPVRVLPIEVGDQRSTVEQPSRRHDARARECDFHCRSRGAARQRDSAGQRRRHRAQGRADPPGQSRLRPRWRRTGRPSSLTTGCSTPLAKRINLSLPNLKAGSHLIMVRATDSAGNIGSGDALIEVKN